MRIIHAIPYVFLVLSDSRDLMILIRRDRVTSIKTSIVTNGRTGMGLEIRTVTEVKSKEACHAGL